MNQTFPSSIKTREYVFLTLSSQKGVLTLSTRYCCYFRMSYFSVLPIMSMKAGSFLIKMWQLPCMNQSEVSRYAFCEQNFKSHTFLYNLSNIVTMMTVQIRINIKKNTPRLKTLIQFTMSCHSSPTQVMCHISCIADHYLSNVLADKALEDHIWCI